MENLTLEMSKNTNTLQEQQLKLIEGNFTKSEALKIINNVVNVKINFHKLQRLSKIEGNVNDKCTYDNSRISELIDDQADMKSFLRSLEVNGKNIKISSTINITVEE